VREGVLVNAQSGRWYPIREGIPTLFVDALRTGSEAQSDAAFARRFEKPMQEAGCNLSNTQGTGQVEADFARIESERRARDEQAEDYDRMLSLKFYERIETPTYRRALNEYSHAASLPLLEAGCGTGRFTGLFSELGSEVVAVDMSRDSILRNRVRHAGKTASPVHYVHADLTHLPLGSALFGSVAHCGVYEHIPSRTMRQQFLDHARRALQPNGVLLLSAYRYGGITRLFGKEGEHAGGIPFTRFTEDELRAEVEPYFQIEKFRPSLGIYMSMLLARPKTS
jgi:SAM-dependent methyltransferase